MAMQMRWSNTRSIAHCNMSRAIPEATGCHHRATNCSVLPQRLPGQQANKQQWKNTPTLRAILMAMAMHWYVTVHIALWQWWRSRASLEATGCCHWASFMSNNLKGTYLPWFYWFFSLSTCWKRAQSKKMAPTNNRGMTYQTNEKDSTNSTDFFFGGGGVHIAFDYLRDWYTLRITLSKICFQSQLWDNW